MGKLCGVGEVGKHRVACQCGGDVQESHQNAAKESLQPQSSHAVVLHPETPSKDSCMHAVQVDDGIGPTDEIDLVRLLF